MPHYVLHLIRYNRLIHVQVSFSCICNTRILIVSFRLLTAACVVSYLLAQATKVG